MDRDALRVAEHDHKGEEVTDASNQKFDKGENYIGQYVVRIMALELRQKRTYITMKIRPY